MVDHYKTLGVSKEASTKEIKRAYKKLALLYHPDKSHQDSSQKFIEITEAYQVLSNPEKRKLYDSESATPIYTTPKTSESEEKTYEFYKEVYRRYQEEQEKIKKRNQSYQRATTIFTAVFFTGMFILSYNFFHYSKKRVSNKHYDSALVYYEKKQYNKALQQLSKSVNHKKDPENQLLYMRILILHYKDTADDILLDIKAIRDQYKSSDQNKVIGETYFLEAEHYANILDWQKALKLNKKAEEKGYEVAELYYKKALYLKKLNFDKGKIQFYIDKADRLSTELE